MICQVTNLFPVWGLSPLARNCANYTAMANAGTLCVGPGLRVLSTGYWAMGPE